MSRVVKKIGKYILLFLLLFLYFLQIGNMLIPQGTILNLDVTYYGYSDYLFIFFQRTTTLTVPLAFLFFALFVGEKENKKNSLIKLKNSFNKAIFYIVLIFIAILFAYSFTNKGRFSMGFSDRSSIQYNPVLFCFLFFGLLTLYYCLYAQLFELGKVIYEKPWKSVVFVLIISYIDTCLRTSLQSSKLNGMLPSDHVMLYYGQPTHPTYLFSFIYFVAMLAIIQLILYFLGKKEVRKKT